MSFFVQATPAPAPRIPQITQMAIFYAVLLVGMAVSQLFTFDTFRDLIYSLSLPLNLVVVSSFPALIIVSEVLALPFLLRMRTSIAFRWLSMMFAWLAAGMWLFIATSTVNSYPVITNVGLLGTAVELTPGWWVVSFSLIFVVLAGWASWGLWPGRTAKR